MAKQFPLICAAVLLQCVFVFGSVEGTHAEIVLGAQSGAIDQQMSPEEFSRSGLNKLSPKELENLNKWLSQSKHSTKQAESSPVKVQSAKPIQDDVKIEAAKARAAADAEIKAAREEAARAKAEAHEEAAKARMEAEQAREEAKLQTVKAEEAEKTVSRLTFLNPFASEGPIYSRIVGNFEGFTGKTHFLLENGEVWKQANDDDTFKIHLENPRIVIQRNYLGFVIKIEGLACLYYVRKVPKSF